MWASRRRKPTQEALAAFDRLMNFYFIAMIPLVTLVIVAFIFEPTAHHNTWALWVLGAIAIVLICFVVAFCVKVYRAMPVLRLKEDD